MSLLRLRDDVDPGPLIEAAATRSVPMKLLELRGEELAGRYGAALPLVRPNQHVAWRGSAIAWPATEAVIDRVRGV